MCVAVSVLGRFMPIEGVEVRIAVWGRGQRCLKRAVLLGNTLLSSDVVVVVLGAQSCLRSSRGT